MVRLLAFPVHSCIVCSYTVVKFFNGALEWMSPMSSWNSVIQGSNVTITATPSSLDWSIQLQKRSECIPFRLLHTYRDPNSRYMGNNVQSKILVPLVTICLCLLSTLWCRLDLHRRTVSNLVHNVLVVQFSLYHCNRHSNQFLNE